MRATARPCASESRGKAEARRPRAGSIAPTAAVFSVVLALVVGAGLDATARAQQVRVSGQFGDLESLAGSGCPEDPPVEPDFDKFYSLEVTPFTEQTSASMQSSCGSAEATASVTSQLGASTIALTLGASMALSQHGGGRGTGIVEVVFEVTEPTEFVLSLSATTVATGATAVAVGSAELEVRGGPTILGISEAQPQWDLQQPGLLEPGVYVLRTWCAAERSARTLPDGMTLFMNGSDTLELSATLDFPGANVVPTNESSLGALKSRYRAAD